MVEAVVSDDIVPIFQINSEKLVQIELVPLI